MTDLEVQIRRLNILEERDEERIKDDSGIWNSERERGRERRGERGRGRERRETNIKERERGGEWVT